MTLIRLATRQSPLALWQATHIKDRLEHIDPELRIELVPLLTQGDKDQSRSLIEIGGKSLFVKELQTALLENHADIAVHSVKDMSVFPHSKLCLAAITERADPRDVFISEHYASLDTLPKGAKIGTSSPRRTSQLRFLREDLEILPCRGNLGTRLQKLKTQNFDAILLAAAGLERMGLTDHITQYLNVDEFIPAIGQGALGIECRANDFKMIETIKLLNDLNTELCVTAERAVNKRLGGSCYLPIGAYADIQGHQLHLRAMMGSPNGKLLFKTIISGNLTEAENIGLMAAENLLTQGAQIILDQYNQSS